MEKKRRKAKRQAVRGYPVRIKIKSEQREYNEFMFPRPDGVMRLADDSPDQSSFTFSTRGYLRDGKDSIDISYNESELTGLAGSFTNISFPKGNTSLVTMARHGEYSTFLVFQDGKRYICAYDGAPFPYQLCIQTQSMKNRMREDGGELTLDYILEINGATAERSRLKMTVELDVSDRERYL